MEFKMLPLLAKIHELYPERASAIHVHPDYYKWLLDGPCQRLENFSGVIHAAYFSGVPLYPRSGIEPHQVILDVEESAWRQARSWHTDLTFPGVDPTV
jgi:hypothetical protein